MPFDISILPVFILASLVLLITPGPDMAFIVATGVAKGRRTAMFASAGIALAMFSHWKKKGTDSFSHSDPDLKASFREEKQTCLL